MRFTKLALLGASLCLANPAVAQPAYPSGPITMVVGFAPGGSTDQIARIVANGLSTRLGQTVVVENRAGATGNIAAGQVSRSKGDGHTLLLSAVGLATTAAFNPSIMQAHPTKDLVSISLVAYTPNVLLASEDSGFKTLADVLEYAKKNPGRLDFGHSGYGGGLHLTGEIFSVVSGMKMNQVPYKGVAPMMQDLIAGHTQLAWDNLSSALPLVRGDKVRAIAIAAAQRSPELPDVPTMAELGYPDMDFGAWFGVSGPKSMPPELAKQIADHISAVLDNAEVKSRITALAIQPLKSASPEEFANYLDANIAQWRSGVERANVKVE